MEERPVYEDDKIDILDYLLVIAKRKGLIIKTTLFFAIVTAIISLILPPIYRAETRILPPQKSSSSIAMEMASKLAGVPGAAALLGVESPGELYAGMLKSNTILDRMIDRFNLMELYETEYRSDARKRLLGSLDVSIDRKSGIITVAVEDKDPERAARMANAFVEELKRLTQSLAITEASRRRIFFEQQLKETREKLIRAEEDFRKFQERTGALKVDAQAQTVLETIAELKAQIAAKEVEINVMRTYTTPDNPDLQKAEEALRAMKAQLRELERKSGNNPDPLLPTGKLPELGIEYIRKMREVKFLEALYELLLKGYEQARLDEARDAIVIQVIDRASPPERRIKPNRRRMVILATFIGSFISIFAAFLLEFKEKAETNPESKKKIETIKGYLKFSIKRKM